jgi:hypothetical protein
MNGAFSGVDGMEVERLVDVLYTDIVKARKMLDKMNMKACADIANEVGRQIEELQPHVPFIMGAFFMIVPYFTSVYICLHLFTSVYICLHLFTSVYICLHLFTSVYTNKLVLFKIE